MKASFWCIQEKEKESWRGTTQALKTKLEVAESNCIRAEIEAAKLRSILTSFAERIFGYSFYGNKVLQISYLQVSWS